MPGKRLAATALGVVMTLAGEADAGSAKPGPLDPRGRVHLPIGAANALDTLKTFVEAEGSFSPGFGSYGVYFWVFDPASGKLAAPSSEPKSGHGVPCERGLADGGLLIPWSEWRASEIAVRTEVCQVDRDSPAGRVAVVGARVVLRTGKLHEGRGPKRLALYVALRPLGPAGFDVGKLAVAPACAAETASARQRPEGDALLGDALLVDGHPALVACRAPSAAGVLPTDTIGELALAGKMPAPRSAESESGECSGALRFEITLEPGQSETFGFVCPVLPGRRASAHRWDGVSEWAQLDLAEPNPPEGGVLQPDPGLEYYRGLDAETLFAEAEAYWRELVGRVELDLPDPRWAEAFAAIAGHVAVAMNEGAPDVAVVNYNVFNRDGVYVANILQKAGRFDLAEAAIDYFLGHPFNGRSYPEADNPGQILWIMGEHWRFTRERAWLGRVFAGVEKLVALVRYYRTTPGPHWVRMDGLEFGDDVPVEKRRKLEPGRCDGHHPEYTEAFDIAGLRAAATLALAMGRRREADEWGELARSLMESYDARFGERLARGYGSYCVLWPCRLYPLGPSPRRSGFGRAGGRGSAHEQFRGVGAQSPSGWRYFPLARAHQGLLTGDREAGHVTIGRHLDHPQMRGWYVFDEGGRSGSGGWGHVRTTWDGSVAMPHGWAIAELHLLLRDSLVFEDASRHTPSHGDRLVLFAGVPPEWLTGEAGIAIRNMPTHFGELSLEWRRTAGGAEMSLGGAAPPGGFVLRLPVSLFKDQAAKVTVTVSERGEAVAVEENGDCLLPAGARTVSVEFPSGPSLRVEDR